MSIRVNKGNFKVNAIAKAVLTYIPPMPTPTPTTTPTLTPTNTTTPTVTPTNTETPTQTSTPTVTPTRLYDFYLANEYACSDCGTIQFTGVTVAFPAGTSVTLTKWYRTADDALEFNYQITETTTPGNAVLLKSGQYNSCLQACGINPTPTPTNTSTPASTPASTSAVTPTQTPTQTLTPTTPATIFSRSSSDYANEYFACLGSVSGIDFLYQTPGAGGGISPAVSAQMYTNPGLTNTWTPGGSGWYLLSVSYTHLTLPTNREV